MKICFIPALPDKTAQVLLKTFAEFEIVFSRKIGLPGKSSYKLAKEIVVLKFFSLHRKICGRNKNCARKGFFERGVVRFTNHHYFLTIHNKSVVL